MFTSKIKGLMSLAFCILFAYAHTTLAHTKATVYFTLVLVFLIMTLVTEELMSHNL